MGFLLLSLSVFIAAVSAWAYPGWESRVPNGDVYGCNTCHLNYTFGAGFAGAGNQWTSALAAADSDGDGYANGVELLDPDGTWSEGDPDPGDPADLTNPDDPEDNPPGFGE
jgi:hypothetical protein